MQVEKKGLYGDENKNTITIKDRLLKYLSYYPLFILSLILCVAGGWLYIRYTPPKYIVNTNFLVKTASTGSGSSGSDLIEKNYTKQQVDLNNEQIMISSKNLMSRVVAKGGFNISYYKKGHLVTTNIYQEAPFRLIPKEMTDSSGSYSINVKEMTTEGGIFSYGPEKDPKTFTFQWNVPFKSGGKTFVLVPVGSIRNGDGGYVVNWRPISDAAAELSGKLSVRAFDEQSSVIQLSMVIENLRLGEDILDAVIAEYNLQDIEERNKLSESTVKFVDERLSIISNELRSVEGNLENYQGSNELIDIKNQSSLSLGSKEDLSKSIRDISIKKGVATMIYNYISNPANSNKLVPSTLGLDDATLSSLINQYNAEQLRKERELPNNAPNSTVITDLNNHISNIKESLLESMHNISKGLDLQEGDLREQNSQYRQYLASLPHKERVMQEIKRKQSITEGLYLYLFQKREEAAISSTSANVSHYKQIDPASGYGPIEPNTRNIMMYSALLGLCLPFGIIYLKSLLNDKIVGRDDILKKTWLPVIGDIGHIKKSKKLSFAVLDADGISEQFRIIRTNLSFILKSQNKKVILVTSSVSNEGKSFTSTNLAAIYALLGKKVALLEFDLRNPTIATSLGIDAARGLSDFLSDPMSNLGDLFHVLEELPTLHIYPSGPIPNNPGDILLTERLEELFEKLKEDYDYIIMDAPPAGLTSDPFVLAKHSDVALYVIRQRFTEKKQLAFINDISLEEKINHLCLVLNDVKTGGRYSYYGYGYGNGKYKYAYKNKKAKQLF